MQHELEPGTQASDDVDAGAPAVPSPSERHARLAALALGVPCALAVRDGARAPTMGTVGFPDWFLVGGDPLALLGVARDWVRAGGALLVRDARGAGGEGPAALAGVPLLGRAGEAEGYLLVADERPRDWSDAELAMLREIASTADAETHALAELAEHREAEDQLRHSTLHDALTGLPNRALFTERLAHAVQRVKRHPEQAFAVLFIDLDRFKVVNDSLGHHVGDELLIAVADRLQRCLREEDTVARLGGDEFALLLEGVHSDDDAVRVAERIHTEFSSPVNLGGFEVFTSMSVGIVMSSSAHELPAYLLRSADMAMYNAKAAGRARWAMFDHTMHAQALFRLQLDTDLRRAVERDEFHLNYQPVVNLATGRLAGFEALIRWAHPERGFVSPTQFIPVAEETGLIVPMGRWVLREACRQLREWQDRFPEAGPLFVSVNISARQFAQSGLSAQVSYILRETRLDPASLKLEITESSVLENTQQSMQALRELRALGVEIYMDDFGTGYSSLSYLHRLEVDALKIDRSFVRDMATQQRQTDFVTTILMLARSVRLRAVAEGVEHPEQLAVLRRLGCDFGQGYLFSPPVDPSGVAAMIAAGKTW